LKVALKIRKAKISPSKKKEMLPKYYEMATLNILINLNNIKRNSKKRLPA